MIEKLSGESEGRRTVKEMGAWRGVRYVKKKKKTKHAMKYLMDLSNLGIPVQLSLVVYPVG